MPGDRTRPTGRKSQLLARHGIRPQGVEPHHPDQLLDALAVDEIRGAAAALAEMAARRRRSPISPTILLDRLELTIPRFVTRCRPLA